jgi:hypothetical protein
MVAALIQGVLATIYLLQGAPQSGPQQAAPSPAPQASTHLIAAAVVLSGLGIAARYRPGPASVAALGVFVAVWIIDVTVFKMEVSRGLIFRIVMLAMIVRARRAAKQYRALSCAS